MSHNVSDRASNDHLHWSRNAHRSSPPERDFGARWSAHGRGASLAAAIYTKTLQNYRRTISDFCALRPTVFDREVLAFDVARFRELSATPAPSGHRNLFLTRSSRAGGPNATTHIPTLGYLTDKARVICRDRLQWILPVGQ